MKLAPLMLWLLLAGAMPLLADDIRRVSLQHGQLSTSDGFQVRIVANSNSLGVERYGSQETLWLSFEVPQVVGQTDFSDCRLVARDQHGHTLLIAPLGTRKSQTKQTQHADAMVQRAYAPHCEIHFYYAARPLANLITEYVLPVADHLPAAR